MNPPDDQGYQPDDEQREQKRQEQNNERDQKESGRRGLVLVNTGNGKGKSTAAFGIMTRAWGRGMDVCVVQFIKHETGKWGEVRAAEKMGIEWLSSGDGFTWTSEDIEKDRAKALHGWDLAREKITAENGPDIVILDEFTYVMDYGWLDTEPVIEELDKRPDDRHVVITGRNAPPELINFADCVTEMKMIKHPYHDQDLLAQKGVDY